MPEPQPHSKAVNRRKAQPAEAVSTVSADQPSTVPPDSKRKPSKRPTMGLLSASADCTLARHWPRMRFAG